MQAPIASGRCCTHRKLSFGVLGTAAFLLLVSSALPTPALAQPPTGFAWGVDGRGVLGDGLPLANQNFPVPISDGSGSCCLGALVDIQGADTHSLALDSSLRIWTWGSSFVGQLGNGTSGPTAESPIPVQVPGLSGKVPAAAVQETIAAEGGHNLVIDGNGSVWTWGANDDGELGIGNPGPPACGQPPNFLYPCRTTPVQVALGSGDVVGVGAGARHSLAIIGDCVGGPADAYAWGDNSAGQLGDGTNFDRFLPVQVHGPLDVGFLNGVAKVVGGQGHTVALMCNGDVFAWGGNGSGQLGSGSTAASGVPTQVVMECPPGVPPPRPLLGCPIGNIVDIAAGFEHSLAVDSMGAVWFWGANGFGQLCDGGNTDLLFATFVPLGVPALTAPSPGLPLDVVAAGANFSFILTAQNSLLSCGSGVAGQLGNCANADSSIPVPVRDGPVCSSPFSDIVLVEAGESHGVMLADRAPSTPTPSATLTRAATATVTPTPTNTITRTATRTITASFTATRTATRTPSPTPPCDDPISILISTGQNAVPVGSSDPIWSLAAVSPPFFPAPGPSTVISPSTAWTTLPNTQWISASTSCTLNCPAAFYDYELCWEQCGEFGVQTPMSILADNRATVFLDGNPVVSTPLLGFNTPTIFTFSSNPGPGTHILRVRVENDGIASGMDFDGSLHGAVRIVPCGGTPTATPTATRPPTVTATHTPTSTSTATPTSCVAPPADMVAWLTGDNNALDVSGNGNHGALQGAAAYTVGKVDDAFLLSAHTDFVTVADDPTLNFSGNLSIDAWVRSTNSSTATIIDKRGGTTGNPVGYHFFISAATLGFQLADGSPFLNHISPGPAINDGSWHHVVVTVDRTSTTGGRLYVDGIAVHTFNPTTRPGSIANASALRIGQRFMNPQPFSGAVDEVELFDRVLSPQEVDAIFDAGTAGKCKPPAPTPIPCVGDCDGDGQVTVDELITGVTIALGNAPLNACPQFDANHDGTITVDEIILAIGNALNGC